jgi:hypothetical protein
MKDIEVLKSKVKDLEELVEDLNNRNYTPRVPEIPKKSPAKRTVEFVEAP